MRENTSYLLGKVDKEISLVSKEEVKTNYGLVSFIKIHNMEMNKNLNSARECQF